MVMVVSTAGIDGMERTSDIYGWATGAEVEKRVTSNYERERGRGTKKKSQRAKERRAKLLAAIDARLAKRAKCQKG